MAELIFIRRGEEVMFYHLDGKSTKMGRGAENDIAFPEHEHYISRHHAVVEERMGSYWLRDVTGQGLSVNGKQMRESMLQDGDRFELGRWEVVFRSQTRGAGKTLITQGGATMPLATEESLQSNLRATLSYEQAGTIRSVELGEGAFHIGTSDQNDLCLPLSYVSGFHCRIFTRDGRFFIRDLDSRNHTWVNGMKVVEAELPDEADIYLGKFALSFRRGTKEVLSDEPSWPGYAGIVSQDPAMDKVFRLIERIAESDAPAMVWGESGTGKELIARAIHTVGPRRDKPMVAINCGALTDTLIESALFGHEKGAFTGADTMRMGAFEEASEGTLFLDEIGDMPLAQQVTLLRVLEGGSFRRMGGNQTLFTQARVVVATHRNLLERVQEGMFREDLFYRVNVLRVEIPPLRERIRDVSLLARFFLHKFAGRRQLQLSEEAEQRLLRHHWPGNVRELRNAIQNAIVMAEGSVIQAHELPLRTGQAPQSSPVPTESATPEAPMTLQESQKELIIDALKRHNWVVTEAAKALSISRSTLYNKMKSMRIEREKKS